MAAAAVRGLPHSSKCFRVVRFGRQAVIAEEPVSRVSNYYMFYP
jgi:hypothetical protein